MGFAESIAHKLFLSANKKVKEHHQSGHAKPTGNVDNSAKVKDNNANLPPLQVQIYCHNIRQENNKMFPSERPWLDRKHGVAAAIQYAAHHHSPTLVGLQEVKQGQLNDVMKELGSGWAFFGVGRDDGKNKGEFAPILYQKSEWDLVSGKTLWLGETPDRPSKGWDAACTRTVSVTVFRHKQSGKVVNYLNTHFDHKGKKARANSSKQIMNIMSSTPGASILSGDFNSEENAEAYKTLKEGLCDSAVHCKERKGFQHTFTGFEKSDRPSNIDFIWARSDVPVIKHEILSSEFNGFLMSDHRPVTAIYEV